MKEGTRTSLGARVTVKRTFYLLHVKFVVAVMIEEEIKFINQLSTRS